MNRRWLPSTMALIPIVYCLAKAGTTVLNQSARTLLRRYLLVSGLRSLFRGAPETQVNAFVNAVRDVDGDMLRFAKALFARIPHNRLFAIRGEDVRNTSGLYSPLMQIYLAYLYAQDARSWPSGRPLKDVLKDGLAADPLAVHHIFPKKHMQDRFDFPVDRLNTVANYAILSQADNSELADQDPQDAWRSLRANQREYASVQLCFLANDNYLRPEAYDEFLAFRAEKLAEQLNNFIGLGKH
jgi:hypothetical protein